MCIYVRFKIMLVVVVELVLISIVGLVGRVSHFNCVFSLNQRNTLALVEVKF